MDLSQFKTVEQLAAAIKSLDMVTSVPWTEYSATSTIVGWTSYTIRYIRYKKIGKLVFVSFYITGTSDDVTTTFTLKYANTTNPPTFAVCRSSDNGGIYVTGGLTIPVSSNMVTVYSTIAGGAWTASGGKSIWGQFWYESA